MSELRILTRNTNRHTSSAANLRTAVNGVFSGTLSLDKSEELGIYVQDGQGISTTTQQTTLANNFRDIGQVNSSSYGLIKRRKREPTWKEARSTHTLYGSFGSDVSVTLNVTFDLALNN